MNHQSLTALITHIRGIICNTIDILEERKPSIKSKILENQT